MNYHANQDKIGTENEVEESFPLLIEGLPDRPQVCIKSEDPDDENTGLIDERTDDGSFFDEPGCSTVKKYFFSIICDTVILSR